MNKWIIVPALLLGGCNLAPEYIKPDAPIPEEYPSGDQPVDTRQHVDLGWEAYFLDPQLRELIALGLSNNQDLAQAVARIEQANARARLQNTQRLPSVDANGSGSKSRSPKSSAMAGEADGYRSVVAEQYTADVGISAFELDLWGRFKNMALAERLRYLSTVEGAKAARLLLISNIASTYYDVRAGDFRIELAKRALDGRREGLAIAKDRFDAGVTATIDYDQAVLLVTQAEGELASVQRATAQARNFLLVLVGGTLPVASNSPLPLAEVQILPVSPGLPSAMLASRPDIAEAEFGLRAANADIGALRAQYFPSITLTGSYGYASPALSSLVGSDSKSWNYGVAIDVPIFDWGSRRARVDEAKGRASELLAAYKMATQKAFQEVADALVGRERYAQELESMARSVAVQRRLVDTARLRYENGISIYLEVLDAERSLFSTEQQLAQLRASALQNDISLYVALGGGAGAPAATP